MNTVDLLIKGRNKELLFDKLKRAKVPILRTWKKGKDTVIRLKYKDLKKAFAILGNMWYNKPIRFNGPIALGMAIKRHIALFMSAVAFFAFAYFFDDYVLFLETEGASQAKSLAITSLLNQKGVKPFKKYSDIDKDAIEREILKNDGDLNFVALEKRANTLLIKVYEKTPDQTVVEKEKNITAKESGVLTYIGVLHGRAVKKVGEFVRAGEVVIEGSVFDGENYYADSAAGRFTLRCQREFESFVPDTAESTAAKETARVKTFLNKEDAVLKYRFEAVAGGYLLKIKITYDITESGGLLEQDD